MIIVKCGYEGCDWQTGRMSEGLWTDTEKKVKFLQTLLLDHQVKVHRVPPAIWER